MSYTQPGAFYPEHPFDIAYHPLLAMALSEETKDRINAAIGVGKVSYIDVVRNSACRA